MCAWGLATEVGGWRGRCVEQTCPAEWASEGPGAVRAGADSPREGPPSDSGVRLLGKGRRGRAARGCLSSGAGSGPGLTAPVKPQACQQVALFPPCRALGGHSPEVQTPRTDFRSHSLVTGEQLLRAPPREAWCFLVSKRQKH